MHFLCSPWISMHLCTQWDQTIFKVAFYFLSNCKIWILNSSVVIGTKKTVTQSNHHHINILIYRYLYQSMFDFVIEIIGSKFFISRKRWKKRRMRLHKGFDLILYFDWEKIKDLQNAFRYFLQECLYAKSQNK